MFALAWYPERISAVGSVILMTTFFFFPKSCEQGEGEELLTLPFVQEDIGAAPVTPPGPFLQRSPHEVP